MTLSPDSLNCRVSEREITPLTPPEGGDFSSE
jgi:hypothetical protein